MTYLKSKNPGISNTMLNSGLFMVRITDGPDSVKKFYKWSFTLVANESFILSIDASQKVLFSIPFSEISFINFVDRNEKKQNRHRFQIITKSNDVYRFDAENDPLVFLSSLERKIDTYKYNIDCHENPQNHKYDELLWSIWAAILAIVFLVITIIDAIDDKSIVLGIITFALSVFCCLGSVAYFLSWLDTKKRTK